ncbi:MAG: ATP-binding protein [Renibacterium salmoninarum]|nr:ATP-binding protein [Renibacterium salmoninarum]
MTSIPTDSPVAGAFPWVIPETVPDAPMQDREADLWTVEVLGASISFSGFSDLEMAELDRCWHRCNPRRGGRSAAVFARHSGISWRQQHEDIVSLLTLAGINSVAGRRLMFHAGGISDPESGRSLALVAKSGTGKTTAIRNLARQFGYLSDETIAIDPASLQILPYPKPLSVLGPDGKRPKQQYSPEELALSEAHPDPVLHRIVLLHRVPGTDEPLVEPLGTAEALGLLVPDSSSLSRLDRGLVALAEVLTRTGGAIRVTYAENTQLTPLVPELLRQDLDLAGSARDWTPVDLTVAGAPGSGHGGQLLRRVVPDDAIRLGESLAVLNGERFDVVSGIGAAIWTSARSWRTEQQLHAAVLAEYGAHPESERLVAEAVGSLQAAGLLLRSA